jgi:RNA polymerase sigma factor for flagellar operon FliA
MELNMEEKLEQFIPLVQLVVAQMKKTLSNQVDESELYSSGMTGLWDASQKFDPSQGVKFETYAVQRIRGAILDGIRQTDHVSRTLRKKEKTFREARETLEQFYLRKPTPKEMTEHLGINPEEYERTLMQLSFIKQESLDEPLDNEGKERAVFNRIEDYYFPRQEEYVKAKEKKKDLQA